MCIAIYSEAGVGYPTKEIFERCWEENHDGAGYAYLTEDGDWYVKKGFMLLEDFLTAWEKEDFQPENTVAIHLRWGTSGKMLPVTERVKENGKPMCHPGCTHPFPVTDDKEALFETEFSSKHIVMHNGIIGRGQGDLSDTMIAIRDTIDPLLPYIKDDKIAKMLTKELDAEGYSYGSRWFITDGADTYLLGTWIQDEETKIYYSKDSYLEPKAFEAKYDSYWPSYAGGPKEVDRVPNVVIVNDVSAKDFLTKKLKSWSFHRFGQWEKSRQEEEAKKSNDLIEVYNSANKCIQLIDSASGEVVWDLDEVKGRDETKHCNDCGADVTKSASWEGLCPYCYSEMWHDGEDPSVTCPDCGEFRYLIDSTFDIGEVECCRCGALFDTAGRNENRILGYNEDTRADNRRSSSA